jgi:hypothetical protein
MCLFFGSKTIILPLFCVGMLSADSYSSALFCRTTDTVPSPFEARINLLSHQNATASTLSPMGRVAITFPLFASITASTLLRQPMNKREVGTSIASPVGVLPPVIGHFCFIVSFRIEGHHLGLFLEINKTVALSIRHRGFGATAQIYCQSRSPFRDQSP